VLAHGQSPNLGPSLCCYVGWHITAVVINAYDALLNDDWLGKAKVLRKSPTNVSLCSLHITHELPQD